MHQRQYIQSLLEWYGLSQAKLSDTWPDANVKNDGVSMSVDQLSYQSILESMLHASIAERLDILHKYWELHQNFNSCSTEAYLTRSNQLLWHVRLYSLANFKLLGLLPANVAPGTSWHSGPLTKPLTLHSTVVVLLFHYIIIPSTNWSVEKLQISSWYNN